MYDHPKCGALDQAFGQTLEQGVVQVMKKIKVNPTPFRCPSCGKDRPHIVSFNNPSGSVVLICTRCDRAHSPKVLPDADPSFGRIPMPS